jgi:hypothetical protein
LRLNGPGAEDTDERTENEQTADDFLDHGNLTPAMISRIYL